MKTKTQPLKPEVPEACLCSRPGVRKKGKDWVCAVCLELETQAAGFQRRRAFAGREEQS